MRLAHHSILAHPWVRRPLLVGLATALVIGGWMVVIMVEQALFYAEAGRRPYSSLAQIAAKRIVTRVVEPFYDHRLLSTTDLPIYDLELTPRRLEEWHSMLDRVFTRGRALEEDRTYYPAVFHFGEESWQVDIRGRGTLSGHYHREKPSVRVRFPRDRYFDGRRVVNFIVPYEQTRIVVDTTLNAIAKQYDLVTYPRKFAVLRMNGEVLGVYQEMDHFRKELAVVQGRSEGFIVSGLGEGKGGANPSSHQGFRQALDAMLECHRSCPPATAERVLDRYFDAEKLAAYTALTTWFASSHAWGPDNLILFFDPAYGRFEPIPWDIGIHPLGHQPRPRKHTPQAQAKNHHGPSGGSKAKHESTTNLGAQFLQLPHFRALRNEILWDMLQRKREFGIEEANRQWQDIHPELYVDTEYSRRRTKRFITGFRKVFNQNAAQLEELLTSAELEVHVGPSGFEFLNRAMAEVDVESVTLLFADGTQQQIAVHQTIPGQYQDEPGRLLVRPVESSQPLPSQALSELQITATNHLSRKPLSPEAITWKHKEPKPPLPTLDEAQFHTDEVHVPPPGVIASAREWRFAGTVRLVESLVTPDRMPVVFEPGLRLFLDADVLLVVRGDLSSRGTQDNTIEIKASDPASPFASLAVIGRPSQPVIVDVEHTTIDGGKEGDYLGIHMSGAFSIYSGSLDMRHSRLLNAAGEDGLNVKYGSAVIEHTLFENTASDAVDLDFCSGTLRHNTVRRTLGDGFDFSGSIIEANDNVFEDCADKGMSIGEDTILSAHRNTVRQGTTGAAVKDLSRVQIEGFDLQELEVGVAVYQKKQVFGPGMVRTQGVELEDVASDYLTDPRATLIHGDHGDLAETEER